MFRSEKTILLCKWNYHRNTDLLLDWFSFNQKSQSVVNYNVSKATEYKAAKQEVKH